MSGPEDYELFGFDHDKFWREDMPRHYEEMRRLEAEERERAAAKEKSETRRALFLAPVLLLLNPWGIVIAVIFVGGIATYDNTMDLMAFWLLWGLGLFAAAVGFYFGK